MRAPVQRRHLIVSSCLRSRRRKSRYSNGEPGRPRQEHRWNQAQLLSPTCLLLACSVGNRLEQPHFAGIGHTPPHSEVAQQRPSQRQIRALWQVPLALLLQFVLALQPYSEQEHSPYLATITDCFPPPRLPA